MKNELNYKQVTFHLVGSKPIGRVTEYTLTFKNGTKRTLSVEEDSSKIDFSEVDEVSFKVEKEQTQ